MQKIILFLLSSALVACQTTSSPADQILSLGKNPILPAPSASMIPTINIAKASKWPDGVMPNVNNNFIINVYSKELVHPRWLYVLPNGDVLVAQSNKQSSKSKGLKEVIAKHFMKRAGAG